MKKDKKIELRVTEEEKSSIQVMAENKGLKISEFILSSILNSVPYAPTSFNLKIVSVSKFPNLKISYNQLKVIIESLYVYKNYVENSNKPNKLIEFENVIDIISFLENLINYNFENACNNCLNKFAKKYIRDDPGQETFSWL